MRILACALALALAACSAQPSEPLAGSTVKLLLGPSSHCSGAHLGSGLILTAQHCTTNGESIKVKTDTGTEFPAEVLWANGAYDVALLKAELVNVDRSALSCRLAAVGDQIEVSGNPADIEFVRTRGRVLSRMKAYDASKQGGPAWREIVFADVTVAGGNSDGPVLDRRGSIIGILVGGYGRSASTLAIIVPAPTVCRLLGRA